jgi:hypothetical protein
MSENKVDIFEVLTKVDQFDLAYFRELNDAQKKSLAPYTLMLWMSGCKSKLQLQKVNMFMNRYLFDISMTDHRELFFYLACISSDGKKKRYNWIKKNGKGKVYSTTVDLLVRYYQCSKEIALSYVPLLEYEDIEEIAFELGEQDDTLKKIKKEFK